MNLVVKFYYRIWTSVINCYPGGVHILWGFISYMSYRIWTPPIKNGPIIYRSPFSICLIEYRPHKKWTQCSYSMGVHILCAHCVVEFGPPPRRKYILLYLYYIQLYMYVYSTILFYQFIQIFKRGSNSIRSKPYNRIWTPGSIFIRGSIFYLTTALHLCNDLSHCLCLTDSWCF